MTSRAVSRLWIIALALGVVSLLVSGYLSYRHIGLAQCLAERDLADQRRTVAIARATDQERRADLALIKGVGDGAALRAAALAAREHTDRVRAENPAPRVEPCE